MEAAKRPIIRWDGKRVPKGLKGLPPGRYRVEPLVDGERPSAAEEKGILKAIRQIEAGQGIPLSSVISKLRRSLKGT